MQLDQQNATLLVLHALKVRELNQLRVLLSLVSHEQIVLMLLIPLS
jgi:hypothetical protein